MKLIVPCLVLLALMATCQSNKTEQTTTGPTATDTTVVDDDTLENTTDDKPIDATVVAVATLPDSAAADEAVAATNFYIIPGKQVGMITATATETSLIQLVGQRNVTHEPIETGGGDTEPGTTLFKGTANEVHILWKDKKRFAIPETVLIRPTPDETLAKNVVPSWRVDNGIMIGSTLEKVEKINGRPFKLYGFGWDMGGTLSDAQGGKLQDADGKAYLSLTFGTGTLPPSRATLVDAVSGNSEFSSSLPVMQQINPVVETIQVRFR